MQAQIYKLSLDLLQNQTYFQELVSNVKINYYWSDEWDEAFYVRLAQLGFISTSYETSEGLVLLPELQFEYALLDFNNLHIGSKVKKLLKEEKYMLSFDTHFAAIVEKIAAHHHKDNWLTGNYLTLMKNLHAHQDEHKEFQLHSIELLSKTDNELVAGEIGYTIGTTYTSLSGFSSREKRYNNCGKLQLVLLAKHLQKREFSFWNLGHPYMEYKKRLGVTIIKREAFLQRWQEATFNQQLKDLYE